MGLVRLMAAAAVVAAVVSAQSFSLTIGNVTAAKATRKATNGMAVRAAGCTGEVKLTGVAVRSAGGTRASTPLTIIPGEDKGVWAAFSSEGVATAWLAVVNGECGAARAGLIVPFDTRGLYNRDKAKFLAHAPTTAEIDAALKELD